MLAIVLAMMAFGFMTGMAVGLAFSVITFVFNYARLPVIRLAASGTAREPEDIAVRLVRALGPHPRLADPVSLMERSDHAAGDILIHGGEEADDNFIVGSGVVKVQIRLSSGRTLRLRSMTASAVLGEVAFYLGVPRTDDVIVERDATLFKLTRGVLEALEKDNPELAVLTHRIFARALTERLAIANRMISLFGN